MVEFNHLPDKPVKVGGKWKQTDALRQRLAGRFRIHIQRLAMAQRAQVRPYRIRRQHHHGEGEVKKFR